MATQQSVAVRNAKLDAAETAIGVSAVLKLFSNAIPADCAAADAGTPKASGTLPVDWMAAAAAGVKAKSGAWTLTGLAAAGLGVDATHYRIYASDGVTCHEQGDVRQAVALSTNALTAANSNVLNFAATTNVVVGMRAAGTGVVAGSTVIAVGATTVTLSHASTAGVADLAAITFDGDMTLDNVNIASGQVVTVSSYQWTAGNV